MADPRCGMLIVYPESTEDIECGKPAAYVYKDGELCCCVECFEPMDDDIKAEYLPLGKGGPGEG